MLNYASNPDMLSVCNCTVCHSTIIDETGFENVSGTRLKAIESKTHKWQKLTTLKLPILEILDPLDAAQITL